MNYSKHYSSKNKGSLVWKRHANTANGIRRPQTHNKNIRLTSQSSQYSILNEPNSPSKINSKNKKQQAQNSEWNELKSLAKRSTIASRMQLKKQIPIKLISTTQKTFVKSPKSSAIKINRSVGKIIDSQGNVTKTFKKTDQFQSLNPHIQKDMNKLKKKVYNMYVKQKQKMQSFLTLNDPTNQQTKQFRKSKIGNQRTKSLYMDFSNDPNFNRITQRPQFSSRKNSNKNIEKNNNYDSITTTNIDSVKLETNDGNKNGYIKCFKKSKQNSSVTKKSNTINSSYNNYTQTRTTKSISNIQRNHSMKSSFQTNNQNKLLKGLLGQYSNYQKLSKHQLIKKLISLEYLAQNIFKKNKYLQEKVKTSSNSLSSFYNTENNFHINITNQLQSSYQNQNSQKQRQKRYKNQEGNKQQAKQAKQIKKSYIEREIFVIDNNDGYFNEFLETNRKNQFYVKKQAQQIVQEQKQRFRED